MPPSSYSLGYYASMLRDLFALVGAALLSASCSGSQSSKPDGQRKSLQVITPGDYAPFAVCTETAPPVCEGFDVALLESYAASRQLQIHWTLSTWAALTQDLRTHDLAIGGITIREERSRVGPFSDPIVRTGKQALMRCADDGRFPTWEKIEESARIVANLGGGNESFARTHFDAEAVRIIAGNKDVPTALLRGEADVFFTDGPEAELLARTHESLCIGLSGKLHKPFELAFWFGPQASDVRDDFTRYLRSNLGSELIRALRIQYKIP